MNNQIKPCDNCKLPLAVFNISYEPDGTKIYHHNHCGKEVKREKTAVTRKQKECPSCKAMCDYCIYETGHFIFNCESCKSNGAGGWCGGAGGGGSGKKESNEMQNKLKWYQSVKVPNTKTKQLTYYVFCYALMRSLGYGRFVSIYKGLQFFLGSGVQIPDRKDRK